MSPKAFSVLLTIFVLIDLTIRVNGRCELSVYNDPQDIAAFKRTIFSRTHLHNDHFRIYYGTDGEVFTDIEYPAGTTAGCVRFIQQYPNQNAVTLENRFQFENNAIIGTDPPSPQKPGVTSQFGSKICASLCG